MIYIRNHILVAHNNSISKASSLPLPYKLCKFIIICKTGEISVATTGVEEQVQQTQ